MLEIFLARGFVLNSVKFFTIFDLYCNIRTKSTEREPTGQLVRGQFAAVSCRGLSKIAACFGLQYIILFNIRAFTRKHVLALIFVLSLTQYVFRQNDLFCGCDYVYSCQWLLGTSTAIFSLRQAIVPYVAYDLC